jgi:hypothetical protein
MRGGAWLWANLGEAEAAAMAEIGGEEGSGDGWRGWGGVEEVGECGGELGEVGAALK